MSSRRMSVMTLVVAAAALSTAAVGTIAAPAQAAQHAGQARGERHESTLSIRVKHPRIEAGDTARVLGDLHVRGTADQSGRTVTLEARPEGATAICALVATPGDDPEGGHRIADVDGDGEPDPDSGDCIDVGGMVEGVIRSD